MKSKIDIGILIKKLNRATVAYDEGHPIMTDKEWDNLYFELQELEKETGIILSNSPSNTIYWLKVSELKKVKHDHPMLSLGKTKKLEEDRYAFVPILRAGMGMLDGVIRMVPNAKIGHIGMYRDEETFEPVNYFFKVPSNIEKKTVIILDPMLATGGSALDAIEVLKEKGVKRIKFLSIISAPEGLKRVQDKYPDIEIYTACIDEKLNSNKYIVPGLGDAGDRIFGTK